MENSRIITLIEKLEMFLYSRADRIITVTQSFKDELVGRGVDSNKIDVVLNGVDLSRYSPVTQKDEELAKFCGLTDKFVVGYIGTHGLAHGLEHILEAARLLQHRDDIRFVFAGGGAARTQLHELVSKHRVNQCGYDSPAT